MKLLGSTTSPYVRRLRLWLADKGSDSPTTNRAAKDYEFVALNIFEGQGRETLKAANPAHKVPLLQDGEQTLYDSRVIFRYLSQKFGLAPLSWEAENRLTLIDAANDTFVSLLLLARSGVDTAQPGLFFTLQHERTAHTMSQLEAQVAAGEFNHWDYPAICLFCLIDWVMLRELYDFSTTPHLQQFHRAHQGENMIAETDPRRG